MLAILKIDSAQIIGKTDEQLFSGRMDGKDESVDEASLQGQPVETEQSLLCLNRPLTFNFARFPMREPSGRIMGFCGIARDVTERRAIRSKVKIGSNQPGSIIMKTTMEQVRRAAKTTAWCCSRVRAEAGRIICPNTCIVILDGPQGRILR